MRLYYEYVSLEIALVVFALSLAFSITRIDYLNIYTRRLVLELLSVFTTLHFIAAAIRVGIN